MNTLLMIPAGFLFLALMWAGPAIVAITERREEVKSMETNADTMPATLEALYVAELWTELEREEREDIAAYMYAMESRAEDGDPYAEAFLADRAGIERFLLRRLDI